MSATKNNLSRMIVFMLVATSVTSGVQAQNNSGSTATPLIYFSSPDGVTGYDKYEWTEQVQTYSSNPTPYWYWAQSSSFTNGGDSIFYWGLQPDGEYGKTALFSFFGSGTSSSSPACKTGADTGAGTSCHIAYAWTVGHSYKFTAVKVSENSQDKTTAWKGSVTDTTTGAETTIGTVNVPTDWGLIAPGNVAWAEWFTGNQDCAGRAYFKVLYDAPIGYSNNVAYQETVDGTADGTCATYSKVSSTQYIMQAGGSH